MTSNDRDVESAPHDDLPGYPEGELEELIAHAKANYRDQIEEHGTGKNWLQDEARWHIWKACDELFQARDYVHEERVFHAYRCMADALNHMLMAAEIAEVNSRDE